MTSSFLPYGRQTIYESDVIAVVDVLRSDYLTTGPIVEAFEMSLSRRMDDAAIVSCSSGTAALHLAALALGLEPGDWVVVPSITFVATANAVRYTGADVIFCDVDPDTGLMTGDTLQKALDKNSDKNIRAVFPVHRAGQPADPIGIAALARRAGLSVVEDACHALGTFYPGKNDDDPIPIGACAHADMAVFSFHPVKTIACGEGGAVSTRNEKLAQRLRLFRNHGMVRAAEDFQNGQMAFDQDGAANPWYHEMSELGFNYRLSDINAALGNSQLQKLEKFIEARQGIATRYDQLLKDVQPHVQPIKRISGCSVGWHLYPVLIDFEAIGIARSEMMTALRDREIGTQVHYIPVSSQPYYQNRYGDQDLPGAEVYYAATLSLPIFPGMTDDEVVRVVDAIQAVIS